MQTKQDTSLILVRHGQINANIDKRWHGWTDSSLNDTGRQQAERAAERIAREHPDIAALYASPLQRTRHTAEAIAKLLNLDVILEPNLKEYGIGVLEDEKFADLERKYSFFTRVKTDPDFAPEGGESINQVAARISEAFNLIQQQHQGKKVLAVSHGAIMALGLARLLHNNPMEWERYFFQNTSLTEVILGQSPQLIQFNSVEHLQDV
ncbi:Phosphoglycerate/bisphosphoglycerate mutase [gamma proteobacterium HdN1]|nr:Phosphoglycerate/bisphosphoglycerate mutase [gamma proteobacterium HdN1]